MKCSLYVITSIQSSSMLHAIFDLSLRVLCNTQHGGTVVGNCSKQDTVVNSITKAKYVDALEATKKLLNHIVHS